jgi:hypothetical protein
MSAATSGHELPYKIVPPKAHDLSGIKAGGFVQQKQDICWVASRGSSNWWVKETKSNRVVICPVRGKHLREQRNLYRRPTLQTEYRPLISKNKC